MQQSAEGSRCRVAKVYRKVPQIYSFALPHSLLAVSVRLSSSVRPTKKESEEFVIQLSMLSPSPNFAKNTLPQ